MLFAFYAPFNQIKKIINSVSFQPHFSMPSAYFCNSFLFTFYSNLWCSFGAGRLVKLKGAIEYVWSHGEKYKVNGFSCYYCTTAIASGGATRFRQHLGGISGSVAACPNVPRHVKELMVDEVTRRRIRSKKNRDLKHFIQREVMAANRNYGTHGNTRIPHEEAQIQMAMRESLREYAFEHGSPPWQHKDC